MADTLIPLPDEEVVQPAPPGVPAQVAERPHLIPGLPVPLPDALLESALEERRPFLEQYIPRRERTLPGEVISAGLRGAVPGTIGAFGQAAEAVGLPSVGKPLRSAAKTLRDTYPGIFEPGQGAQEPGVTRAIASGVEGLATSLGVSVPAMVAAAATSGAGFAPIMAAYILGSPAVLSAASYQQFYEAAKKAGVPEDVASNGALQSALAEGVPELVGNVLETLFISKGLTKAAARAAYRKIVGEVGQDASLQAVMKPAITNTLGRLAATAGVEAGTEGATQVIQQKVAADTGLRMESAVGEAMGAGAVAGILFGVLGGAGARLARGRDLRLLANPGAPAEQRQRVADRIGEQLLQGDDPELGDSFLEFTTKAIQNGEAIPLGRPVREVLSGAPTPAPPSEAPAATPAGVPAPNPMDVEFREADLPEAPVSVQRSEMGPPLVDETAIPETPVSVQASTSETPRPPSPMAPMGASVEQSTRAPQRQDALMVEAWGTTTGINDAAFLLGDGTFVKLPAGKMHNDVVGAVGRAQDLEGVGMRDLMRESGAIRIEGKLSEAAGDLFVEAQGPLTERQITRILAATRDYRRVVIDVPGPDGSVISETFAIPAERPRLREFLLGRPATAGEGSASAVELTVPGPERAGPVLIRPEDVAADIVGEMSRQGFQGFSFRQAVDALVEAQGIGRADAARIMADAVALGGRPQGPPIPGMPQPRVAPQPQQPMGAAVRSAIAPTASTQGRQAGQFVRTNSPQPPPVAERTVDIAPRMTPEVPAVTETEIPTSDLPMEPPVESIAPESADVMTTAVQPEVAPEPVIAPESATPAEVTADVRGPREEPRLEPAAPLPPSAPTGQLGPTPSPVGRGFTQEAIAEVFPGLPVTARPDGAYRVTLPSGGFVDLATVEAVPMGEQELRAFEVGYGVPWDPARSVAGRFIPGQAPAGDPNSGARIELVLGRSDRVTLRHEVQHFLEHSGLLTPEEVNVLEQAMRRATKGKKRGTEDRAQWVAEQLNARGYRRESVLGQVLDKVWAFLDRLLALAGIQTSRGVLRRVESGEVFRQDTLTVPAQASAAVQQFATAPPRPQAGRDVEQEKRLLTEYVGFMNMATPEIVAALGRTQVSFPKYVLPTAQRQEAAVQLVDSWAENPALFQRAVNDFRRGNIGNSVTNEAFRMVGRRYLEIMTDAALQNHLTQEQFDHLVLEVLGPNSLFATIDTASAIATAQASEAGRVLRAQQDIPNISRVLERLTQLKESREMSNEEFKDWLKQWSTVMARGDVREQAAFIDSIRDPTLWEYINEFRYGSILSGPTTQIANFGGNVLWTFFNQAAIRPIEGIIDAYAVSKLQNRQQQRFVSEVWPAMMGFARGLTSRQRWRLVPAFIRGGHEAIADLPGVEGRGLLIASKLERDVGQHREAWRNARWGQFDFPLMRQMGLDPEKARAVLKKAGIEPGQPVHFMRKVAPIVTLAMRAMSAMDILTGLAAYDAEIAGFAERQARIDQQEGRLQGQTVRQAREHYLQHPTEAMHQESLKRTQVLTFTDEPSALAKLLLQGRNLPVFGKPLHLLLPFVATPDRLIARALELMPGLGLVPLREGLYLQSGGTKVTELLARQLAGTVMALGAYALYEAGRLTGPPPEDPEERESFYRQGKQAYAVELGGGYWLSYRRFEPLNMVLSMWAITSEAMQRYHNRNQTSDALSILTYTAMATTQHVLEGSYLSGIEPLFGGMYGRADPVRALSQQVDALIPFQGLRATLQRATDAWVTERGSIIRQPRAFFEYITGVDAVADVAVKYDVWGRPVVVPGNVASAFIPWRLSSSSRDPVEAELARLKVYPGMPDKRDAKGELIPQGDYDYLVREGGKEAKAKLDQLVRLPSWGLFSDATRERLIRRAIREGRDEARRFLQFRTRPPLGVPAPSSLLGIRG